MAVELRKSAKELVASAKSGIENLTPERVENELKRGDVLLVDVRDTEESGSTIPGAIHVTRGMLEFRADSNTPYHNPELRPDRRIILHCAAGSRSALSVTTLEDMGFTNVAHLDGGIKAWQESGRPVETH